jgi:hypothetical protein
MRFNALIFDKKKIFEIFFLQIKIFQDEIVILASTNIRAECKKSRLTTQF